MTAALQQSLARLERYTARASHSIAMGEYAQAMADVAEIHYIADQLWLALEKVNKLNE